MNRDICEHGNPEADGACKECYLLRSQNTEQDRVLCEMEHALNEADAIMEEVDEETADAWRREWKGLKEWEINDGLDQIPSEDVCSWSFRKGVYFAEAALKEKNHHE